MSKISKKDQDPNQVDSDRARLELMMSRRSEHFTQGTRVQVAGKGSGLITHVFRCKCRRSHKMLTVVWDDGTTSRIQPLAVNRYGEH